jgi:aminomethyltransferase
MKETPLTGWHREHGAKMAEFGGFLMPMEYTGILDEHRQVRGRVGLFDVSHMAEFRVEGAGSSAFLDRLVTNWPSQLVVGQALYTPMCYGDGGTVDDLLIYRLAEEEYVLVTNAANHDTDLAWILGVCEGGGLAEAGPGFPSVRIRDESDDTALIAVQGPEAERVLSSLTEAVDLTQIPYYHFVTGAQVAGHPTSIISRTGYTGEDGFEVYLASAQALPVWEALVAAGARPAGLGARDTLRLEARLPLYGHELSPAISPLEAGLGPFVKWDKPGGFVGLAALAEARERGLTRRLAGLYVDQGIARAGAPVGQGEDDTAQGVVTSGSFAPTLNRAVALALVPPVWGKVGTTLWVEVRGRHLPATVVKLPFYRRPTEG